MATTQFKQPQVSSQLLCAGYMHEDTKLDLYGCHDEDGHEVIEVTLAGSKDSLCDLVPIKTLVDLGKRLDYLLPNGPELVKASREEARAERHQWDREFAIA